MRYLLDTCVLSDYFRRVGSVHERVHARSPYELGLSVITEHEVRFGLALKRAPKLEAQVNRFLEAVEVLPFGREDAQAAALLRASLRAAGRGPQRNKSIGDRGRGARLARREEGAYPSVRDRRATKPAGMDRPRERSSYFAAGPNPIGDFDALIAGVAVARQLILVTSNEREFERVRGLEVENWR